MYNWVKFSLISLFKQNEILIRCYCYDFLIFRYWYNIITYNFPYCSAKMNLFSFSKNLYSTS